MYLIPIPPVVGASMMIVELHLKVTHFR